MGNPAKCPNCNSTRFRKCLQGEHFGKQYCEKCGFVNDPNYKPGEKK